jgi:hypothetical protein
MSLEEEMKMAAEYRQKILDRHLQDCLSMQAQLNETLRALEMELGMSPEPLEAPFQEEASVPKPGKFTTPPTPVSINNLKCTTLTTSPPPPRSGGTSTASQTKVPVVETISPPLERETENEDKTPAAIMTPVMTPVVVPSSLEPIISIKVVQMNANDIEGFVDAKDLGSLIALRRRDVDQFGTAANEAHALHRASTIGASDIVAFLVDNVCGGDLNHQVQWVVSSVLQPLLKSLSRSLSLSLSLLALKIYFETPQDSKGRTAMALACEHGHTTVVEMLLRAPKIDLNIQDSIGTTSLHWATKVKVGNGEFYMGGRIVSEL